MPARSILVPVLIVVLGMAFVQTGASFAKLLFPVLGASGSAALRLTFAAIILLVVFRPWRQRIDARMWKAVLMFGAFTGVMNLTFYASIQHIPLGIAVAIEFIGPLAIALIGARRPLDFFWIALAIFGFAMLLPWSDATGTISPVGVFFALCAGACWAGYIIYGQRAGIAGGTKMAPLAIGTAAIVALPFGIADAGWQLLDLSIWPLALAVALLSTAIPYSLDLFALPHIPARLFSILMSGQPAMAALSGLIFLHETIGPVQLIGMAGIMAASMGATLTIARQKSAQPS